MLADHVVEDTVIRATILGERYAIDECFQRRRSY
jgi:hypothetical protein